MLWFIICYYTFLLFGFVSLCKTTYFFLNKRRHPSKNTQGRAKAHPHVVEPERLFRIPNSAFCIPNSAFRIPHHTISAPTNPRIA